MAMTVTANIVDAKGQKHEIPTQQQADTKNFHKFAISENKAGVVGSILIPIQRKAAGDKAAKSKK